MEQLEPFKKAESEEFALPAFQLEVPQLLPGDLCLSIKNAGNSCPSISCDQKEIADFLLIENKETQPTQGAKVTGHTFAAESKPLSPTAKPTARRWGRIQDKVLFQSIREMESQQILSLDILLSPEREVLNTHEEAVAQLILRCGWKASPSKLLARIKTLWNSKFSFRETKALKKILKEEYNYENINFDKVIYEFPGKRMAELVETCEKLKNLYETMRLSQFKNSE